MHATHWYIDIDGTLTTAQMREDRAFSTGVAVGSYGTPERHYPHGKEAFAVFGDPDLFHTDQTMEGAEELIHRLNGFLVQSNLRFSRHVPSVMQRQHIDLVQRGLWLPSMRLICKPSDWHQSSASFKATVIAQEMVSQTSVACYLVDNSQANREAKDRKQLIVHPFLRVSTPLNGSITRVQIRKVNAMSEVKKMKKVLIEAVRTSDPEVAQDVIPRLESLMEDWTESQVRDYLKYTLEGAYSTRLPLEEDQIKDEATLLVRTGQTAKCIVFRRTSNGIHILVNPPSMQPDPRLAIESGLSPRDRLVKTTTKRRNGWKLPGGRANAVDVDLAKTQPFPSQTGVLLMTALREMTEEFGHCMQVVLKHDDAHFSYDTSTEALIEFDMKFERPMLLLYAHRTHGPEVWESERVGKYQESLDAQR